MRLNPGTTVDRYVVERLLGSGGMASVYLVKHAMLGTEHALKVLIDARKDVIDRLILEGKLQANLDPRYVVPVTDLIMVNDAPALLMPFIAGASLRDILGAHRPDEDEIRAVLYAITAGISSAHQRGIVHRDLKPGNVMVEERRGTVQVRVCDFGIARAATTSEITQNGDLLGTVSYCAPEQLENPADVDERADLWSIGALAYELLVGRTPFSAAPGEPRLGPGATMLRVLSGKYDLDPVPTAWQPLIEGLLAPDRDERWSTADQLLRWLSEDGQPLTIDAGSGIGKALREICGGENELDGDDLTLIEPDDLLSSMTTPQHTTGGRSAPNHALPKLTDAFIGRDGLLASLEATAGSTTRLISLVGTGGVGKTRLAVQFARGRLQQYPGGVWYCDLSDASSAEDICAVVGRVMGVPLVDGDASALLGHALSGRRKTLLVLDTCEHLTDAVGPLLESWLNQSPNTSFLATSRAVLHAPHEQVIMVPPLSEGSAVELFITRARTVKPDLEFDAPTRADIRELVHRLDLLPLAIELAAARIRMMSPADMLGRIHQRFRILSGGRKKAKRHATLRATLDWSWGLLSETQKQTLRQLGVFEGSFSLDAAEAVIVFPNSVESPFIVDILQELVEQSLLRALKNGRFELLRSVQEYALSKLRDDSERMLTERRHARFYSSYGHPEAIRNLRRAKGQYAMTELQRDLENVLAACERAIDHGHTDLAVQCLQASWSALSLTGPYNIAETLAFRVVEMPGLSFLERAHANIVLADCVEMMGKPAEAEKIIRREFERAKSKNDLKMQAAFIARYAMMKRDQVASEDALQLPTNALQFTRSIGDTWLEAELLGSLSTSLLLLGRNEEALERLQQGLVLCRQNEDLKIEAALLGKLGQYHIHEGDIRQSVDAYQSAVQLHRRLGDRSGEARVLGNLGENHIANGAGELALKTFRRAIQLHQQTGQRDWEALSHTNMGSLLTDLGRFEEALTAFDNADALVSPEWDLLNGVIMVQCAVALALTGEIESALVAIRDGRPRVEQSGYQVEIAKAWLSEARVLHAAGRKSEGISAFRLGTNLHRMLGGKDPLVTRAIRIAARELGLQGSV